MGGLVGGSYARGGFVSSRVSVRLESIGARREGLFANGRREHYITIYGVCA